MTLEKVYEVNTEGFRKLARVEDVPEGQMLRVLLDAEEWEVAITKINGQIHAFRDVCPHQAFPLSVGQMHGCQIVCAGHNWTFDVCTGAAISPPIRKKLELYPVKVENGDVWVQVRIW